MASTKARNASVAYNMRAVGGLLGGERQLANFKKLRFENKYKDVPPEEKEALFLKETVDEFALPEAEDTERLHKVRQATAARQFEALQALPKFGVATYANTKETDPDLAEKAIRGWAHLLEGQDGHEALCEARKELDGLLEGAKRLPPPLARTGARMHQGVSREDEWRVIGLGRLDNVKLHAAFVDAKARGSTVELVGVEDPHMGRLAMDAWFDLLAHAQCHADSEALRAAIRAHIAGDPPSLPGTPPKVSRQPGFKGTPEQPLPPAAPVPAPAPAEQTPPPLELELPVYTGTYDEPQTTTWAFQKDDEEPAAPAPAEQTPNAKPAPEAPPEQPRPVLTVNVEVATKPLGAGKNLEAALDAAEGNDTPQDSARIEYLKELTMQQAVHEAKSREWDLSITYIRCPPGHHFIDDEGHIAPNEKKRKRPDSPPTEKKAKTLTNVDHELNEEAGTTCPPPVAA